MSSRLRCLPRVFLVLKIVAGVVATASVFGASALGQNPSSNPPPYGRNIQRVVIIFQENRSTDNLFQDPVLIKRGADIAQTGINSMGQTIPLKVVPLDTDYDLGHTHASFVKTCDLQATGICKMDGANLVPVTCNKNARDCPAFDLQYGYVNPSDVQPYFALAEQYAFADRMFQTNQGPSFPAHQFIISGTSAPTATSDLFASENPGGNVAGCIAPASTRVALIDPSGRADSNQYPCFEHPTITDLLEAKKISWSYYTPLAGSIWTAPDAIEHICQPQKDGTKLVCAGQDWAEHVVIPQSQVLTDIANLTLAQVTWVIPSAPESDHAGQNDGSGPSWVASIVNAIGNSPYWETTAILIAWDDWGGWYDHVPPPEVLVNCAQWGCGYVYGFRVPLIVVSPFARAGYISHVQHDFGSILKFIEETYGLPSLGYADEPADDLSDCFDFTQPPRDFQTVPATFNAQHFLNDPRPPTGPDDD